MNNKKWDLVLENHSEIFNFRLKEIWDYRDLLILFVRRDFVSVYKQTILGPLWYIVQPLLTTLTFTIIFGKIAKISTGEVTPFLFYLSGITFWQYFSECVTKTSNTFAEHQDLFSKIYFPRRIVPLTLVVSSLFKFLIQFLLFLAFLIYFSLKGVGFNIQFSYIFFFPFLLLLMAMIAIGFGMIFSSLTAKYKDLSFLLAFGVQLWMYVTPIIYPVSSIPEKYAFFIRLNPLCSIIEAFRFIFLGSGTWSWDGIVYSAIFATVLFLMGNIIFGKTERSFMDTI